MLLQWNNFLCRLGRAGEPCPLLSVIDVLSCDQYVRVSLNVCLLVLNVFFSVSVSTLAIRPDMFVGWFRVEFYRGLGLYHHAYLQRFLLALSSHCGGCTMIFYDGTLYPWTHRCVSHTKFMEIVLLGLLPLCCEADG